MEGGIHHKTQQKPNPVNMYLILSFERNVNDVDLGKL